MSDQTQEKWHLPAKRFAPTPEKLDEWNAQQTEAQAAMNFRQKTAREILFENALIRIGELNALLDDKLAPFTSFMARSLAENYAIVGNFDAAAFHEPDSAQAAEYEAIYKALKREDQNRCSCMTPDTLLSNVTTVQEIYHEKQQRYVQLQKCVICRRFTIK